MSEEIAISVENVSKAYRIWESPSARLLSPLQEGFSGILPKNSSPAQYLRNRATKHYKDFYALSDISFVLKRGESVGIIGRNGSGKSTLLQVIAGTLQPTEGSVKVNGRVAALLELGAGFNPEFTGRENVHLSAAVLGISRQEIEQRFDEIAGFADIGDFLDQAVKTYSSGMMMRLAFAVNTCVDPDILIVDEALSVGDAPFQAKCFRRLRQLIEKGVSLLFVSHDIGTVRSICSRALWLKGGKCEMWGEAKQVAKEYEKFCWREQGVQTGDEEAAPIIPALAPPAIEVKLEKGLTAEWSTSAELLARNNFLLPVTDPATRLGNSHVVLEALLAVNARSQPIQVFEYNEAVTLHYRFKAHHDVSSECMIGIRFRDPKGQHVYSVQDLKTTSRLDLAAGTTVYARVTFPVPLTHGDYIVRTGIFGFKDGRYLEANGSYDFSRAILWDIREDALFVQVRPHKPIPLAGPVHIHAAFDFSNSSIADSPAK